VLLLLYPQHLRWISLAQTLFNLPMNLMVSPANAALFEHHNCTPDPAKRAQISQINTNQDRIRVFAHMAIQYVSVFIIFADPPDAADSAIKDYSYVWAGVLLFSLVEAAIEIRRTMLAAPVTFNRARFRVACDIYCSISSGSSSSSSSTLEALRPNVVSETEPLLSSGSGGVWSSLDLGTSLENLLVTPDDEGSDVTAAAARSAAVLLDLHTRDNFVIGGDLRRRRLSVVLKANASALTQLQALFHAYLTERHLCDMQPQPHQRDSQPDLAMLLRCISAAHVEATNAWPDFVAALKLQGWKLTAVTLHADEWRLLPEAAAQGTAAPVARGRRWLSESRSNPGAEPTTQHWELLLAGGSGGGVGPFALLSADPSEACADVEEAATTSVMRVIYSILLPRGFPDSVAAEYMHYQLYDTLQVMMADLRSILISNAGLIGQGVGVIGVTPLETIWVDFQVTVSGPPTHTHARAHAHIHTHARTHTHTHTHTHSIIRPLHRCAALVIAM
jgi:hypothetical protein